MFKLLCAVGIVTVCLGGAAQADEDRTLLLGVRVNERHDEALSRAVDAVMRRRLTPMAARQALTLPTLASADIDWGRVAAQTGARFVVVASVQESDGDVAAAHLLRFDARANRPPIEADVQCVQWQRPVLRAPCLAEAIMKFQVEEPSRPAARAVVPPIAAPPVSGPVAPAGETGGGGRRWSGASTAGLLLMIAGAGSMIGGGALAAQDGRLAGNHGSCEVPGVVGTFECHDELTGTGKAVVGVTIGLGGAAVIAGGAILIWDRTRKR